MQYYYIFLSLHDFTYLFIVLQRIEMLKVELRPNNLQIDFSFNIIVDKNNTFRGMFFLKKVYLILFLSTIYSQTFGLSGKIISKSSSYPISNVNITIQDTSLGTASNDLGLFSFSSLKAKKYILVVSAIGFKNQFIEIDLFKSVTNITIVLENESVLSD